MKKLILTLVFGITTMFSFTSCGTTTLVTTQDDIYVEAQADVVEYRNIDFNVIVRYGTPYYYNGTLLYYLYNNLYYYPFYYDNYWYVRVYSRPFSHLNRRPYFRPSRHDYRFKPGTYHGFDRLHNRPNYRPNTPHRRPDVRPRPNNGNRPTSPRVNNGNRPRPNVGVPRTPQPTNRNSRPNGGNRRFGGRR